MDITKIDGYSEEMSAEQIVELIKNYEAPQPDMSGYIEKSVFDKAASTLAKLKKDYNAKLTDEEKAKAEIDAIKEENATLKRNEAINKKSLEFASNFGCDSDSASKLAESFIDGNEDFTGLFKTVLENKINAEVNTRLSAQNVPPMGNRQSGDTLNKEKLKNMSAEEISKLSSDELHKILKE